MCYQIMRGVAKVADQCPFHLLSAVTIGSAQYGRRVIRGHDVPALRGDHFSALAAHTEITAQQSLSGGSAKTNDHARPRQFKLRLEPWSAGCNLPRAWFGVQAPLAPWLPFKMLDDVGDENVLASESGLFQRLIEKGAGWTDEWATG